MQLLSWRAAWTFDRTVETYLRLSVAYSNESGDCLGTTPLYDHLSAQL